MQGQLLRGQYHPPSVCNVLINVLSQTLLPDSQQSEDLAQDSMASVAKAPLSSKSYMFYLGYTKKELKESKRPKNR